MEYRRTFAFFLSIFLFFTFVAQGKREWTLEIPLPSTEQETQKLLADAPESLHLEEVSVEIDIEVSHEEIKYLFDVSKKNIITRATIAQGIWFLSQKNKFEKVIISLVPGHTGYSMHLDLSGHWTFYKVKIHGFLLNKDRFGSYYLLEPGQKFDLEKHQKSLERIKDIFKQDGYFSADVREELVFDEKTKTVTVHLTIDRRSQYKINDIEVEASTVAGIEEEEKKHLVENVKRRLRNSLGNAFYSSSLLDQEIKGLKAYLRKKGYLRSGLKVTEHVDRESRKVVLTFSLTIRKKKKFVFFGNHFFSDNQLLEKVSLFGKAASHIPSSIIAAEIEDIYKKNAFHEVKVLAEEEDEKFVFVIKEGQRAFVSRIRVEGNQAFSRQELEKAVLSDFLQRYLDAETVKKIEDGLLQFYRQRGFWDASAKAGSIEHLGWGAYELPLRIVEGDQRFVSKIEVPAFPDLMNKPLFYPFKKLETSKPFDGQILEQQRQFLMQHLHRQGCLYAHVKPEFIEEDGALDVVWQVVGDTRPVTFGKTVIIGNSKLPYENIIRELEYKEGMPWDRDKVAKSLDNLRKLSVFDSVSLYPVDIAKVQDSKQLVLQVVDESPFEARVRLGYQHVNIMRGSTYKVGGSLLMKNPTNRADCIRFDADMTRFFRSVALQYELPWILGQPIRTAFRSYIQTYDQPIFMGSRDILYTADHDGFSINMLRGLPRGNLGFSYGCDWLRTRGLSPVLARAINFEPQLVGKRIAYIFMEPNILIDMLDDSLNPTWGALTTFYLRAMIPLELNNLSFVRGLFEQSFFFPLSEKIVGAIRTRFGHIFHENFETLIPPERFYLGGPYSLRGYEPNFAPPFGEFQQGEETVHVPIGGKTMFLVNLEARFAFRGNFGGVLFQDVGALIAGKVAEGSTEDISPATGFGLRYATPMGPLRFDFGIKWKKRFENDCRYAWYLTFGHAF